MSVAFWILSIVIIVSALMVVTRRNMVHCALFLVLTFLGVAGIYFSLDAEFIGAVQILIYVGAITILLLFAIMLTQRIANRDLRATTQMGGLGFLVSAGLLVFLLWVLKQTTFVNGAAGSGTASNTAVMGKALLTHYSLPFEVASVVLLVALVGAIVLARKEENELTSERNPSRDRKRAVKRGTLEAVDLNDERVSRVFI